jgi:hypothetical protein
MTSSTASAPPAPPSSLTATPGGQGSCRAVSAELVVMRLQQQLREKDLKLTDVRLEALSSAHQLDSLRDAMNRMRVSLFEYPQSPYHCLNCIRESLFDISKYITRDM